MHPAPPPQLQFELADAATGGAHPKRARRLLKKARDVRASLNTLAYEVQWASLLRSSTDATRRMGWQLLSYSRPQGHGVCDHSDFERKANILTSLPYLAIGLHTLRKRQTPEGRWYGASLLGVGAGSITYHCSHGRWRALGRKVDYWAISAASTALVRASRPGTPRAATALSLALTPFQPLAVVCVNGAVAEADFLRRARQRPVLRRSHTLHIAASAAGGAAFIGEEVSPKMPLIHTAWHLLSAAGVAATGAFLADLEADGPLP